MRSVFAASLSSLFLAASLLAGCAGAPAGAEADTGSSADDALVSDDFVGTYRPADGRAFPVLALGADGTYVFDTGIRCIQAPCPSGDVGTWRVTSPYSIRLVSSDPLASEPQRLIEIVSGGGAALSYEGADGETIEFARQVEEVETLDRCAAVRCAGGLRCEVVEGSARCVP
jgi:hypothetical protein